MLQIGVSGVKVEPLVQEVRAEGREGRGACRVRVGLVFITARAPPRGSPMKGMCDLGVTQV